MGVWERGRGEEKPNGRCPRAAVGGWAGGRRGEIRSCAEAVSQYSVGPVCHSFNKDSMETSVISPLECLLKVAPSDSLPCAEKNQRWPRR